jgi:Fe-S-cluster containining protein
MSSGATDWQCSQGGCCCRITGTVEVSPSELEELRRARPEVVPLTRPAGREDRLEILAGPCPYLGKDSRCTVYAVRPWRCRVWSCFRKPGEPYTDDAMNRRLAESAGVRRLWLRHVEEARPWAEGHGWGGEYSRAR